MASGFPPGVPRSSCAKRVGKFGWKANIGNLSEFVRVACQPVGAGESVAGSAGIAVATKLSSPRARSHRPAVRSDDGLHRLAAAAPGSAPPISGRGRLCAGARIRYRIDGILHETPMPPQLKRYQAALISRIKVMSGMNISEKRLPQDGRINLSSRARKSTSAFPPCRR